MKTTTKRKVLHKSRVVSFSGYTRTTTVCGINKIVSDGMNIADTDAEVTCKFCLKFIHRVGRVTA